MNVSPLPHSKQWPEWSVLQVIAVICVLVWVINIGRFGDAMHGGWVSTSRLAVPPMQTTTLNDGEDEGAGQHAL